MILKKISWEEFEVLQLFVKADSIAFNDLATNLSVLFASTIQRTVDSLISKGLVKQSKNVLSSTPLTLPALEPYKVKRAVILGAGRGIRISPASDTIPKPLVDVNGVTLIETQINALLAVGISDITVVRGYLGNKFDSLQHKYPFLQFLNNGNWQNTEGIDSAVLAIDLLPNAYLIEGDLYVNNPNVFRGYEFRSSYCGIPRLRSNDWFFTTDSTRRIKHLDFGQAYDFVGIMFWSPQDALRLKKDIKKMPSEVYDKHKFIESVPFNLLTASYNIYARTLQPNAVYEVDTYKELQSLRNLLAT